MFSNTLNVLACAASEPQHYTKTFHSLTKQLQTYPTDLSSTTYLICLTLSTTFLKTSQLEQSIV